MSEINDKPADDKGFKATAILFLNGKSHRLALVAPNGAASRGKV